MEESVQQELQKEPPQELQQEPQSEIFQEDQQELEYTMENDQGDFRRRLRDRDLLKKRKAEAEEKDTDEWDFGTESPRKRGRSGAKRGRRRGRPRKTESTVITDLQNESVLDQDAPIAVTDAVLGQTPVPLEAQVYDATAAAAVFEQLNPQVAATTLEPAVDIPPVLVQEVAQTAASVLLPLPSVIQEPKYSELQSKPVPDQVLIEDLGPDEEEDLGPTQNQQADEDCSGKQIIGTAESSFFSNPTLSSPPPQEYVPGNSF